MNRQEMESRLQQVAAYRASGQRAKLWCAANGVALRVLSSWCAHSVRWQARLDGVSLAPLPAPRANGFVAAHVAPGAASTSVRVELNSGATRLELYWPLAHTRELAALLRELGR